ncbi:hypothetical protein EVAR_11726_1 [Eumeta japonica]|uniref:Uncharacterized protein n=1 Tax=Eumeta variegata TaxID=151549 RepID=A0A4C1U505_EUMVA|nr:hypothetical protein EVAR_11726_1 [Eumeta japonica]
MSHARTLQRIVKTRMNEVRNENWSDLMVEVLLNHKAYWGLAKALKTEVFVPNSALRKSDRSIAYDYWEKVEEKADSNEQQYSDNPRITLIMYMGRRGVTIVGSGIGIESGTENRIENGDTIRIDSETGAGIENGTRVEKECEDGTKIKNMTAIGIEKMTEIEIDNDRYKRRKSFYTHGGAVTGINYARARHLQAKATHRLSGQLVLP